LATGTQSLTDLFSSLREESERRMEDVSRVTCRRSALPPTSRSVDFSTRYYTPPRTRSQTRLLGGISPPPAPRKPTRERSTDLPEPRRLFNDEDNQQSFHIDYGAAMGIVGFISSFLMRRQEHVVAVSELANFITSVSVKHRDVEYVSRIIGYLINAVPEWIVEEMPYETVKFNKSVKTYEVLSKLRLLKRRNLELE
jgi:hypothetical protein